LIRGDPLSCFTIDSRHENQERVLDLHVTVLCSYFINFVSKKYTDGRLGIGEPLNNYNGVVGAIRVMTAPSFQLSPRKITVSMVGIIHAIGKLRKDLPNLNLAVSLHAQVRKHSLSNNAYCKGLSSGKTDNALREYQNSRFLTLLSLVIVLLDCFIKQFWDYIRKISFGTFCSQQKIFIEYIIFVRVNDEEQHAHPTSFGNC
ncbi:dual-specificity RNA methyltransferase RlmN, partial [Striga asiatica]